MNKDIDNMINKIVDKDFKNSIRGYQKKEVDDFLNEIIDFLDELNKVMEANEKYNDEATREILELKTSNNRMEEKLRELNATSKVEVTNPIDVEELAMEKKIDILQKKLDELKDSVK